MAHKKKNKRHARRWNFFSIIERYFAGLEKPAVPVRHRVKKATASKKKGSGSKRKRATGKRKPARKVVSGVTAKKAVRKPVKRKGVRKVESVAKRHKERAKRMPKKTPEVAEEAKGELLESPVEGEILSAEQPTEEGGDTLSIDLQGEETKESSVEESALRREMETEGIFEGVATGDKEKPKIPKMPKKPKDKKELKKWYKEKKHFKKELKKWRKEMKRFEKADKKRLVEKAKQEKEEEKDWKEEAKRREDLLKKKKEESAKETKEEKKEEGKKKEFKPLEMKKQSAFMSFIRSINYMGMDKVRISFIGNLGTMMDAGLPLLDAIKALQKEVKQRQMKKIMNNIVVAVEAGSPLWRAMEGQYFFTTQQIAMVRVGEESGSLVENLGYLAIQEEKDKALKSKIKTAMIYPTIVMVMLVVVILIMGMFVLPNLVEVISSLGVPLPFITRMIIKFTDIFSAHGVIIAPLVIGGMILFFILVKYTFLKIPVQWTLYKIPGIGLLIREAALSRFGVIMGGLLQSGVPVVEALESVTGATTLVRYKKFYGELWEHIQLGDSFTTSFEKIHLANKCFPASMQQLIMTGEQSGSLTKVMLKIASIHEKKAASVAEKLPVIIEPMLLLIMGGLVGTIALGVLAPIYSVVGNIG